MNTARVLGWTVGCALVAGSAQAQFWAFAQDTGLTDDISNTGVAVGSSGFAGGNYFAWTADTGSQDIGGISPGNGVGGQAKISNDGRYIGGTTFNAAMDWAEMSRYDRNTSSWAGFGMIPGIGQQIDAEVSSGWGMSGDGRSVVGLGWTTLGTADAHAAQWIEGVGMTDLGSNAVGNSSRANAANFDGSVVAGWQDGNGRQAAYWKNGVEHLIFQADGVTAEQEAFDVSDDGRYVTGFGVGGFFDPGSLWRYDTLLETYESLGNIPTGESRVAGASISGDGSMIVGGTWGFGPATFGTGILWTEATGVVKVSDYLDSIGVSYDPGFVFAFASGISADGEWLTGWGNYDGNLGTTTSWVVHIPTPAAPLVFAGMGLITIRRRRD